MILTRADLLRAHPAGALPGPDIKQRERIADEVVEDLRRSGHWPELDAPTNAHAGHGHQSRK